MIKFPNAGARIRTRDPTSMGHCSALGSTGVISKANQFPASRSGLGKLIFRGQAKGGEITNPDDVRLVSLER